MSKQSESGAPSLVRRGATGPRTPAGKMRSRFNAHRHGLAVPLRFDPEYSGTIEQAARDIAEPSASEAVIRLTRIVAEAQLDVIRCRQARCRLVENSLNNDSKAAQHERSIAIALTAIDRYERRALVRRNRAFQDIDCQRLIEAVTSKTRIA